MKILLTIVSADRMRPYGGYKSDYVTSTVYTLNGSVDQLGEFIIDIVAKFLCDHRDRSISSVCHLIIPE